MSRLALNDMIAGLVAGQEETFASLYDETSATLLRTARALTNSSQAAEDAVQEVFASLLHSRAALASVENLRAYMFTILRNTVAAGVKQCDMQHRSLSQVEEESVPAAPAQEVPDWPHDERLARALAALPVEQREVLVLKFRSGMTFADVAVALEINPSTAATRYQNALQKLRTMLSPKQDAEG